MKCGVGDPGFVAFVGSPLSSCSFGSCHLGTSFDAPHAAGAAAVTVRCCCHFLAP